MRYSLAAWFLAIPILSSVTLKSEEPLSISGVYPHLRMWNDHHESGTGAVVLWQGDLWAITYAPHMPKGSTDKLYRISPDLAQHIFEGSVGGTPANRMIHRESNQLLIGPYLIDAEKKIRVIPQSKMLGRLTGNARHLAEPENKVYYATMEEGLYEVDVNTLDVKCLIKDGHETDKSSSGVKSKLLGYHGKGLFSGQGRLVYSNNGENSAEARKDPTVDSGALAQWFGKGDWQLVLREQFTEVSGPGGIHGNENPETDPLWAMGWDAKSLLLALLEDKQWHFYRLPKGSHSYDGAHGWNTEWPRIREIGEDDLLATMHGTFWKFPRTFSLANSKGIAPRSNYLKVIGDFCRWDDRIVLGCDDSAAGEFLNTRPLKSERGAPLQSNSNLWFVAPDTLDQLGPVIGRGSAWLQEDLEDATTSDPYLFSGYDHRLLTLTHESPAPKTFALEVDHDGTGKWELLRSVTVQPNAAEFIIFTEAETGTWIRLRSEAACLGVTAHFHFRDRDSRVTEKAALFDGIATTDEPAAITGVMRSLAYNRLGLVTVNSGHPETPGYYELNEKMELLPVDNPEAMLKLTRDVQQPAAAYSADAASIIVEEDGHRYRLPKNDAFRETVPSTADENGARSLKEHLAKSLLADAEVSVNGSHLEYQSSHAVDGAITDASRWIAPEGETAWIELKLPKPVSLKSFWVVSGWKGDHHFAARNFDVRTRVDGEWVKVPGGEVRNNQQVEVELRFETPILTDHLRIESLDKSFFRIYEIAGFDYAVTVDRNHFPGLGPKRVCREVATERDLVNLDGTFYELPARNAQGFAKIRPVATHPFLIQDFCSHNGLLLFTGIDADSESEHLFRSLDGKAAVWAGVVDDLWKLGKPTGLGGPWKDTPVKAGVPSDPYLMTGYDQKSITIETIAAANIRIEVDIDGTGLWVPWYSFTTESGTELNQAFPEGFSAYWVRAVSDTDTVATVTLLYQ